MNQGWRVSGYVVVMLYIVFFIGLTDKNAYARRFFLIERPRLGLGLSYEFESEKREGPSTNIDDTTHTSKEYLEIETSGWVYHPAFFIYTIRLKPEWEQWIERLISGDRRTRKTFLQGYFIDLTFLEYKPYTLNLFSRRTSSTLRSSFARRSDIDRDTYGASLMLKYRILPTTISYAHTSTSQTGFFRSEEDTDDLRLYIRHHEESNDTNLNATYTDRSRTTSGIPVDTESSHGSLHNTYKITEDNSVVLSSSLSYRWAYIEMIKSLGYGLSENLNLKHRKNLSTNYNILYDKNELGDFSSEIKSLSAGLTHLLYENLTTTITGYATRSNFTGGSEQIYEGNVNSDYRRRIPWGRLNINISHGYKITGTAITEEFIQVIDKPHILKTAETTILDNEHVDLDSIKVTDSTGTIVYIRDIDYRVTEIDSSVRISRTTFGAIADGQEVLVSYQYLSIPAFDYSTFSQSYGVNLYLWSAWRLYYRYRHSKQNFLSGIPPDVLTEDTTHTAGTQLKWKWTDTKLTYEDTGSTYGILTKRWLATEALTFRPGRGLFWGLSGRYGKTKFKDSGETEKVYGFRFNIQWTPTRWGRLKIEGFHDRISGVTENTIDTGASSLFEWFYGVWKGNIMYRFIDQKNEIIGEMLRNHYVLFEIKRKLW